jgi:hypothetical protein
MSPDHALDDDAPDTRTRVSSVDWSTHDSPATAVAEAVADATDRDQTDLEPLQHTVDADALDHLFADSGAEELAVSFTYEGVHVRVSERVVEIWQ